MTVRTTRLRVYVAGSYSGPDVMTVLGNMRRGIRLATAVLQAGFAPFCPWFDHQYCLHADIKLSDLYAYSMSYVECADAVLVVPVGAETSKGTQAELKFAEERGIPIFWSLCELQTWAASRTDLRSSALPHGDPPAEMHGGIPVRSSHSGGQ